MQHPLTPYTDKLEPFAWWKDAFNGQELDWLQQKAREATDKAKTASGLDNGYRRSEVNWLHKDSECSWVFEKLAHVVSSLNASYYRFDLTGFGEPLQLTNYHEGDQGAYKFHQDLNSGGISRKLSLVLQLSDPAEYEGGNLEILLGKDPITMSKSRGLILVFPSWTLHQVTPVVRGSRQTLVSWITGPPFK
jgi:PKHD-type hydroxylase